MTTETIDLTDAKRELAEAIERNRKGIRDPEAIRRARERMDRRREAIFKKFGLLNIAVELVREARDE